MKTLTESKLKNETLSYLLKAHFPNAHRIDRRYARVEVRRFSNGAEGFHQLVAVYEGDVALVTASATCATGSCSSQHVAVTQFLVAPVAGGLWVVEDGEILLPSTVDLDPRQTILEKEVEDLRKKLADAEKRLKAAKA